MRKAIYNGTLIDESDAKVSILSPSVTSSYSVYEALRVIGSKAVFVEDHLSRLRSSMDAIGLKSSYKDKDISLWIDSLIREENIESAQIRITCLSEGIFITYTEPFVYPESYYTDGISTVLYQGERFMPNVKTSNRLLSALAMNKAKEHSAFEALLVNRENRITEGTRSNFYAISNGRIYTAEDSLVLGGITRKRVLDIAKDLGLEVVYEAVKSDELDSYDALFISATSMAAMPIKSVDGHNVNKRGWETILKIKDEIRKME